MKAKQLITGIFSILIMFCFALTFIGCNSDDDGDSDDPTTVTYRVTERIDTEISGSNIWEDKDTYSYLNNLLIEVIDHDKENGIWVEDRKTEFVYDGDWVTSTRYNKEGDDWVYQDMQSTNQIKIVNGKIVEVKNTYMNYVYREVFTYSGDKIIKVEFFDDGELDEKYVCTYNGEQIDEIIEYEYDDGFEEIDRKYEFSYANGNLSEVLRLYYDNGVWINSDLDKYIYSGGKVIQIDDYDYNSFNDTWELDGSENFSYNSNGLLESISESGSGWTEEEIFTYEEGKGNYRLLYGDAGYYDVFNYPNAQRMSEASASTDDRKSNIIQFLTR